jgi:plasmid stabilization system protein ParE
MKVRLTPLARAQLTEARDYIRSHNPFAAQRFRNRVAEALLRLGRFPGIGHAIPEEPDGPERQILVDPYRFFYRVEGSTIWIVAVWHGAQLATVPSEPTRR